MIIIITSINLRIILIYNFFTSNEKCIFLISATKITASKTKKDLYDRGLIQLILILLRLITHRILIGAYHEKPLLLNSFRYHA